ncbi:MAG: hypothetical protein RLN89_14410 [Parvibaculum sp.]
MADTEQVEIQKPADRLSAGERPFDISITHPLWSQLERGIQILLGFSLVTSIHFLAETWGAQNIPYAKIFSAIGNVGMAFTASLLITPVAGYVGIIMRATTNLPNYRINQIRAIAFNIILIFLLFVFFSQASSFITALRETLGVDL